MNIYKGMFLKPFILVVWKPKAINAIGYWKFCIFCNLEASGSFLSLIACKEMVIGKEGNMLLII
jgi:hypothetical protein